MAQYCRYCAYCTYGDVAYCEIKDKTMSEESVKRANKCKDFELNPIDTLGENTKGYQPRKKRQGNKAQLKLEV